MKQTKKILEELAKAPAEGLEKSIEFGEKLEKRLEHEKPFQAAKHYWHVLGPGLTTGAADDDPSGIATYSQTGSQYGFQLLWLAAFTFPLMAVVQEMCARIGLATGRGLAANIRQHYPKWVLYASTALLFAANTFNIGADLGIMAKATELLLPRLNFVFLLFAITVLSLGLQIFVSYKRYAKYLKYLSFVLLAYVFSALSLHLNWLEVLKHGIIPSLTFSKGQIFLICGILGTTISPYLFFWQTSQEVEEEILEGRTTVTARRLDLTSQEIKNMRADTWSGMFFSNVIMFFIIAACAGVLFQNGITNITSATEAALALRPFAGGAAFALFTIGIVGIGLLSVPVLAGSAAYAFSESFGWRTGLYRKLKQAYAFYGIMIISMLIGLLINFTHLDAIKALIYAAVANGIVAPIIIFLIVRISGNAQIMGEKKNGKATATIGWLATIVMGATSLATVIGLLLS